MAFQVHLEPVQLDLQPADRFVELRLARFRVDLRSGPAEEASLTLDERRARWFALVYEGRSFDVIEGPGRHPEP